MTAFWAGASAAWADNSGDPTGSGVPESVPVSVTISAYAELTLNAGQLLLQVARPGATATGEVSGTVNSNTSFNMELTGTGVGNVARLTLNRVDGVPVTKHAGESMGSDAFSWGAGIEVGGVPAWFTGAGSTCKVNGISAGVKPLVVRGTLTTNADFAATVAAGSSPNAETLTLTLSG